MRGPSAQTARFSRTQAPRSSRRVRRSRRGRLRFRPITPTRFNPSTVIAFDLLRGGTVSLKIYDLLGQEVATLVRDEKLEPGRHSLLFNGRNARGRDLPSGVYLYRLVVDGGKFIDVHKMLLLR